jgi:hypothetical protein
MHGCSEKSDNPRPFLHSMGPADWESTIQYGLQQGHIFGFCGNTDHHSAHPGSYGHGRTGVWSEDQTRDALWEAFYSRRTYALTGDKIDLKFSINHSLMGSIIPESDEKNIDISVSAGTAIDYVDIVKDNQLLKRFSQCDIDNKEPDYNVLKTKVYLELGWGERNKTTDWKVELELTEGKILSVEPRFRGEEVVSPVEKKDNFSDFYTSSCKQLTDKSIEFKTTSQANPNNFTCTTQGVCLEVKTTLNTAIKARINDKTEVVPLKRLLKGSYTGRLSLIGSPSYKFNRAPLPSEFNWSLNFQDKDTSRYFDIGHSFYYVRVRQQNDQWAWSSPIFIKV